MKKYLYIILLFLVCVPAIAGTINSYTLKSPPDDADTIVIYDSDDGSTKKIQVGDISGSGINWSSYPDLTALTSSQEFLINNSGTSSSINWEVVQTQLPSQGWTDGGTNVYLTTTTDSVTIGTTVPSNSFTTFELQVQPTKTPLKISSSAGSNGDLLLVTSSGIVGIGTSSPTSLVDVNGDFRARGSLAVGYSASLPPTSGAIIFGNVGIGTSLPVAMVDIYKSDTNTYSVGGTSSASSLRVINSDTTINNYTDLRLMQKNSIGLNVTGVQLAAINKSHTSTSESSDFDINVRNSGTLINAMHIDSDGNIGVGTTSPTGKLNIATASDIGWTVKSGANTACNTTCPNTSGCVSGFDSGSSNIPVACSDAAADVCICAGP